MNQSHLLSSMKIRFQLIELSLQARFFPRNNYASKGPGQVLIGLKLFLKEDKVHESGKWSKLLSQNVVVKNNRLSENFCCWLFPKWRIMGTDKDCPLCRSDGCVEMRGTRWNFCKMSFFFRVFSVNILKFLRFKI